MARCPGFFPRMPRLAPAFARFAPRLAVTPVCGDELENTMSLLQDISFFDVTMSLIAIGVIERLLYLLPEDIVGPGGWLLDTGATD